LPGWRDLGLVKFNGLRAILLTLLLFYVFRLRLFAVPVVMTGVAIRGFLYFL
jgi:hypothetical protein